MRSFLLFPPVRSSTFQSLSIKKDQFFSSQGLEVNFCPPLNLIVDRDLALKKNVSCVFYNLWLEFLVFIIWFMLLFHSTRNSYQAKVSHSWTCVWHNRNLLVTSDTNYNHLEQISLLLRWHPCIPGKFTDKQWHILLWMNLYITVFSRGETPVASKMRSQCGDGNQLRLSHNLCLN